MTGRWWRSGSGRLAPNPGHDHRRHSRIDIRSLSPGAELGTGGQERSLLHRNSPSPLTDPFVTISRDSSAELREALRQDYAQRAGRRWAGNSST